MRRRLLVMGMAGWLWIVPVQSDTNTGELRFLTDPPATPPHHHRKLLIISGQSLEDDWIQDHQCHEHLDPVPALEIVFAPDKVRHLRITRVEHIGHARVEGSSIQLTNVQPDAVICLESELHALIHDPLTGWYTLSSGPYMRRFLDGYFPLKLTLSISYPADQLRVADIEPLALRNSSQSVPGRMNISALFEGRLVIKVQFAPLADMQH